MGRPASVARGCALLALLTSACASYSTRTSARPTPVGATRYGFNFDVLMLRPDGTSRTTPNFEFVVRHGLTPRIDIGGKVGVLGGEMNSKLVLTEGTVSVAVLPSAGIGFAPLATDEDVVPAASFGLPLLVGLRLGEHEVVAAPRALVQTSPAESVSGARLDVGTFLLLVGGTLGVRFQLDDFVVFPELGVYAPYAVDVGSWEGLVWQGGIGVQFGSLP